MGSHFKNVFLIDTKNYVRKLFLYVFYVKENLIIIMSSTRTCIIDEAFYSICFYLTVDDQTKIVILLSYTMVTKRSM